MINTTGRYTDHELAAIYLDLYDNFAELFHGDAGDRMLEREIPLPDGGSFVAVECAGGNDEALIEFLGAYVAQLQEDLRQHGDVRRRVEQLLWIRANRCVL